MAQFHHVDRGYTIPGNRMKEDRGNSGEAVSEVRVTGSATPVRGRWSRIVSTLGLAVVSAFVGVLLAEVGLRMFRPQIFPVHPPGMYTEHETIGRILTRNYSGSLQRAEFNAPFSVNSLGFRGAEPRPRTGNSFRIVALGDSQTFGFGVLDDETFPFHLERLLSEMYPGLDVQVINTGSPTFGTYNELQLLRERWDELDPDLVLLQFLPVNDFEDNRYAIRQVQPQIRDGMLVSSTAHPPDAPQPPWVRALGWSKNHLHVARLASEGVGYLTMRMGWAQKADALWGEDFTAEDARLTQDLLEQVALTAHAGGAGMLFLYSTSKAAMMETDYAVPRSRSVIEAAAGRTGAYWLDLNELMREYERPWRFFFVRDGHWSAAGHQVIAEILAAQLTELSLVSGRESD